MAKTRRSNFTEKQKAQIFARDRATCALSGRSLWILDYGAACDFAVDWADHIIPCAKGGRAVIENGACLDWSENYDKRASADKEYLFLNGKPTPHFFRLYDKVPQDVAHNLKRFAKLHYSDWFFNRALFRLLNGITSLDNRGRTYKRDDHYYAKAAYKAISQWKGLVRRDNVTRLEKRGLAPPNPGKDQELMLAIQDVCGESDILDLMNQLLPFFKATYDILESLTRMSTVKEALAIHYKASRDAYVSERIRQEICAKARSLGDFRFAIWPRKKK